MNRNFGKIKNTGAKQQQTKKKDAEDNSTWFDGYWD